MYALLEPPARELTPLACAFPARTTCRFAVTFLRVTATHTMMMNPDEALEWLREVNGQLYRNKPHPTGKNAWVAVVRTPRAGTKRGKLIIALGDSMEEATSAAEGQWQRLWERLGASH